SAIVLLARSVHALNVPIIGVIVDNTHTKYRKFKPWIVLGALPSGIITILLFTDFGLKGTSFLVVFGLLFILWDLAYTTNDISYWSMLPALTTNQHEREKIGSFAKLCADIGLFAAVVGLVPTTGLLRSKPGRMVQCYYVCT